MARIDWEKRIQEWEKEGRGQGRGPNWVPYIFATEAPTDSRRHRPYSPKFGREMHLLSDAEHGPFMLAEWASWVDEAREQFPIPRELSLSVAKALGIQHPCYPGSHVPCVLTLDLLVEGTQSGKRRKAVFDSKLAADAEDRRTLEKLQIAKACAHRMGCEYTLVLKSHLPKVAVANLAWIRSGVPRPLEQPPYPDYWDEQCDALYAHVACRASSSSTLTAECKRFSATQGISVDHALRAARILLYRRRMETDIRLETLHLRPISQFQLCDAHTHQHRGAA